MRLVDEFKKKHPIFFASVDFSAGSVFVRRDIYRRSRGWRRRPSNYHRRRPVPIYKPKPTPTPAPEELDVVRVTSNLIVVPVSVTDANGQPGAGIDSEPIFALKRTGSSQQVAQLGDPEQVPLDIALLD